MEKIDKAIEILQAYKSGKTIEACSNNNWDVIKDREELLSQLYYNPYSLRIKPEPKYRPYANAEEFLKDSKIHGPYIINSTKEYFLVNQVFYCGAKVSNYNGNYSFKGLLELFKWQDGSPCGILE